MPYVGNQIRQFSDRVVLDSLTASATADYTLQLNSVDFVPSSAESLTVSLNGIIQAPISSYTVSGSTLSFDSALTASDTIDFIIAERGITLQTPSAGSVNTTQLASNAVTSDKMFSTFKNGITEADMWRITANVTITGEDSTNITTNFERVDTDGFNYIGTGMTESSGVFSFPSTGIWQITATGAFFGGADGAFVRVAIHTTTDNSTYTEATKQNTFLFNNYHSSTVNETFFDVTDITTHKVKFIIRHNNSGSLRGDTNSNRTAFKFIRLGDT